MKNVIIIGSNSIIAQNFYSCQQHNDKIKLLRISRQNNAATVSSNHIQYDLSRPYSVDFHEILVAQIRTIIDLSHETVMCLFAWSGTPRSSADPSLSESIKLHNYNIIKSFSFLIKDLDLSQIIFLSSAGGIYNNDNASSHNESSIPSPATPYGFQKLEAESMLGQIAKKLKVPLCVYRVSCAYGFNISCPDQGVMNKWIFDGLLHRKLNLINCLDSELNFISYDQISKAIDLGINLYLSGIFNIGTSSSTSLRHIYNLIVNRIPDIRVNIMGKKRRILNVDCSRFKAASGCEFDPIIEDDFSVIFNTICLAINQVDSRE